MNRKACFAAAVTTAMATAPAWGAQIRFDDESGDGKWETPQNWVGDALPSTADVADIGSNFTASISSAQTVQELQVGWPNSSSTYVPGTSTLNILPGTNLILTASGGSRIGRAVQTGQAVGSSKGVVNQTGGLLQINTGTNGLRLSQADNTIVADSQYIISGGSVRGGPTNGSMTAPLQLGVATNSYNRAEFRVVGSGPTEIRFEDIRITPSTTGVGAGETALHFVLDANGVTPMIAEDELRITGSSKALLEVSMMAPAPQQDITLIWADRITGSTSPFQPFHNAADGSSLVTHFEDWEYTWNVRYFEDDGGSDNGVIESYVKLEFVSAQQIPEPSSLAVLGLGGLALLRRRR